jgi:hypothetical protein
MFKAREMYAASATAKSSPHQTVRPADGAFSSDSEADLIIYLAPEAERFPN